MNIIENVQKASSTIQSYTSIQPKIGLILGSGLGILADEIEEAVVIPYEKIPGFPVSTVEGHAGELVVGKLEGVAVAAMKGRFHYYEGYSMQEVTFPVRVMHMLGIEALFVTNAAGGINESFKAGNLMRIKDHINQMGANPLIGKNEESFGTRFPDMSNAYSERLAHIANKAAKELEIDLKEGVYAANTGPCYETPTEINMLRVLGADAVGMSTVPEVIAAAHSSIQVLGISCISNMAAGILDQPLSHDEVMETTTAVRAEFLSLMKNIVKRTGEEL
ncbi:purine-nucleoside phosphorylase [Sinobaca qinghaiensis]|uniref:Purine nucleoside phosphorylase n=1 Tax=Sinobaca qinghaiensis TaxID=342944 RepID=A0A419V312_9BACL|nr:purine-nucleoside phosphorylase [Sinobaca qinghaiensis]RKD72917.1 purine-nucleoside phosphorylase [Sinobaca qinghaiensis]